MKWLKRLLSKSLNPCDKDCPKGGECPRIIKARWSGQMYVENHFGCTKIQMQVEELDQYMKYVNHENKSNLPPQP